jgi:hypothetical protein
VNRVTAIAKVRPFNVLMRVCLRPWDVIRPMRATLNALKGDVVICTCVNADSSIGASDCFDLKVCDAALLFSFASSQQAKGLVVGVPRDQEDLLARLRRLTNEASIELYVCLGDALASQLA